ncbi:hypothetical protein LINPERHAP1_LOCUS20808, partial [Linum perenne]
LQLALLFHRRRGQGLSSIVGGSLLPPARRRSVVLWRLTFFFPSGYLLSSVRRRLFVFLRSSFFGWKKILTCAHENH